MPRLATIQPKKRRRQRQESDGRRREMDGRTTGPLITYLLTTAGQCVRNAVINARSTSTCRPSITVQLSTSYDIADDWSHVH